MKPNVPRMFPALHSVLALGVIALAPPQGANAREFIGTVLPGLMPYGQTVAVCKRLSALPTNLPIPARAQVFAGSLNFFGASGVRVPVLLVEPSDSKDPFIFVDVDRDGVLAEWERFHFSRAHQPGVRRKVRVTMAAVIGAPFARLPVDLGIPSVDAPRPPSPDERYVLYSYSFLVSSNVRIDGQRWFFRHTLSADATNVDLKQGYQALDTGRPVPFDTFSPRMGFARGEPLIFRIGRQYVSVSTLDLEHRRIAIRTWNASDYRRLELERGLLLPDFEFVDIDGRHRRLSEFKGRYVLLNFWFQGCTPCSNEFPFLREALRRFGPQGLTIVGLSEFGQQETMRALIGVPDPAWVEADPASVRRLVEQWFQIRSTPSQILIGTDGRILLLGRSLPNSRPTLRGPQLVKTLGRILQ